MALAQRGHGAASHLRPLTPIADVERLPHHGIKFLEGRAWWPATAGDRVGTKPTDAALPSPRPGPRREDAAPGDRWHRRRVGQELPGQQLVRWHHAVLPPSSGPSLRCRRHAATGPAAAVPPKLPAAAAAPPPAPAALVAGIMLSFDNHDFCATEVTRLNQWPQLERLLEMPNPAQESSVPRQAREVEPEWLKQCARVYPGTGKSDARGRSAGKIRACSPRSQPSSELPIYSRHNPHSIPEATHPAGATRARRYQIPLVH